MSDYQTGFTVKPAGHNSHGKPIFELGLKGSHLRPCFEYGDLIDLERALREFISEVKQDQLRTVRPGP